jgi:sigma-B regulation protein RsbU (phosphoserine phosphatase)
LFSGPHIYEPVRLWDSGSRKRRRCLSGFHDAFSNHFKGNILLARPVAIRLRLSFPGGQPAVPQVQSLPAYEHLANSKTMQPRILIADDQQDVLDALRLLLKGHGYTIETVSSPSALLSALNRVEFDLVLMDLNYARDTTSGREGLDTLTLLKDREDPPPVVAMTGWATVGLAVETMQFGVSDFVEKPWNNSRLLEILEKQIALGRERRETRRRTAADKRAQEEALAHMQEQEREIAEARAIQQRLMPRDLPQLPGYQIAGAWQSAGTVGGDYFDVLQLGEETLGLCIADVAGKGMPAALLMSNLQAAVRGLASVSLSPETLCARLNSLIYRNTPADRFITFFYAQLDCPTRQLRYANAGHNPPFVLHRDGSHDRLREGGMVLGVLAGHSYTLGATQLSTGDQVLFYTDGVTEACNAAGEEFGEARLLRILLESAAISPTALQEKILSTVAHFSDGHWRDDATLLVLAVDE